MAKSTTAAAKADSPNDLIYMHNEKTGGVKAIFRKSLAVWEKRGWKEGVGKAKNLPDVPTGPTRVHVHEDGTAVEAQGGTVAPAGAASVTPAAGS